MSSIALGILAAVIFGIGASVLVTWASGLRPIVTVLLAIAIVVVLAAIAIGLLSMSLRRLA